MTKMARIFIALKIPDEVLLQIKKIKKNLAGDIELNWEREEKIHLTLKFIGNVKKELVGEISESLNFIETYKKINLSLTRFKFFYKNGRPTVLWAGISQNQNLIKLVDEINDKLFDEFSIPKEQRKYRSHLTLLRIKNKLPRGFTKSFNNYRMPQINFVSDEVALMRSKLLAYGSKYSEIKKYKLK